MTFNDLLVAYDGSDSADAALELGARLADKHEAKLTGLLAHGAAEQYESAARWINAEARDVITKANAEALENARQRFERCAASAGLKQTPLLDETGRPDLVVAEVARFYDLTLIGRFGDDARDARLILHPDRIALKSGRPLLVVPEEAGDAGVEFGRALFAWDGGRSAARALSDALHLLKKDAEVKLVTVGSVAEAAPGKDIKSHLENHRLKAEWVRMGETGDVGAALLECAESEQPDLMVMGAYEHSKFKEDFFGGVTDTLMRKARVPVLVSH